MSGTTISSSDTRLEALQLQSSAYGVSLTVAYGVARVSGNLLWYNNFKAIPHTSSSGGGKGGVSQQNTTYSYTASVMMGLCEGTVAAVSRIWKGKAIYADTDTTALAQLGLSLASGTLGQATWSYLDTNYPTQAIGYSGVSYVYAADYALNNDATVNNHSFEVVAAGAYAVANVPDANPAVIAADILTNARYGAGYPASNLVSMTDWSSYCAAANLLLSPVLDTQTQAFEVINSLAQLTNTAPIWTTSGLKMVPYGDTAMSGNGASYTPSVTPIYDLTDDDFAPSGEGDDPIKVTRKPQSDAYNCVKIEFLNRSNFYNVEIATAQDSANIDAYGLRTAQTVRAHWICDATVAQNVAQLILQRNLYVRNRYEFDLPWTRALLEPMDLVTLSDAALNYDKLPVRITEINESETGYLTVTAEEFPQGIAHAAIYASQASVGFQNNYSISPGNVSTPVVFEAPGQLTSNGLEIWVAVRGASEYWGGCNVWMSVDGISYKRIGVAYSGMRYGALSSTIVAGSVGVTLNDSTPTPTLVSTTIDDAAALNTLCYIGGDNPEFLAYTTATLVSNRQYNLGTLVRGAYDSNGTASHAVGDPFVRCDTAIVKSGLVDKSYVGKNVYFKFTSFNIFGVSEQSIASVASYSYAVTGAWIANADVSVAATTANYTKLSGTPPAIIANDAIYMSPSGALYGAGGGAIALGEVPGNLTSAQIPSGILDATKFAASIEPVSVVSSVPTGKVTSAIFNTTDSKLYRWNGTSYVSGVIASDISGTIPAASIGAGLTASQITSVNAAAVGAGLTGSQIAANTITGSNIVAGTVAADKIAANSITAAQIAANTITAGQIAANTITAGQIAAGAISATQIAAAAITGTQIAANSITASNIDSRGLSIKDANGTVILAAGSALDFANVGGTTKPANNATSGANLIKKSTFSDGNLGGWTCSINAGGYLPYGELYSRSRDVFELDNTFYVKPGEMFFAACDVFSSASSYGGTFGLAAYNSDGTVVGWLNFASYPAGAGWTRYSGHGVIPASAVSAIPWFQIDGPGGATLPYVFFSNPYIGRQQEGATTNQADAVTNAGIASAATTANYGNLSGTPSSAIANNAVPNGTNLIVNAGYKNGTLDGWTFFPGSNASVVSANLAGWQLSGGNTAYIRQDNGNTNGYDEIRSSAFPCVAGARYEYYAYTGAHRCLVEVFIWWFDASGRNVGNAALVGNVNAMAGGTLLAGYLQTGGFCNAPANAAYGQLTIRKNGTYSGYSDSYAFFTNAYAGQANSAQTVFSAWSPSSDTVRSLGFSGDLNATNGATFGVDIGGQITPANVSTYIANAAIGNAQIGGNIQSSGWSGTAGWLLDRAGNLYANSGTFRGDITGSSGTFSGIIAAGSVNFASSVGTSQAFTSPGTYSITVPAGMTSMRATLQAGGGGGGAAVDPGYAGGGGGGGGWVSSLFTVTPGNAISLTVGGGGAGGGFRQNGSDGGNTTVSGYVSASGGGAGKCRYYGTNTGGAAGGAFATAGSVGLPDVGGAGGSSKMGAGGASESSGSGYGAGGGGGDAFTYKYTNSGGNGANGYALIEFFDSAGVVLRAPFDTLKNELRAQGHTLS